MNVKHLMSRMNS